MIVKADKDNIKIENGVTNISRSHTYDTDILKIP